MTSRTEWVAKPQFGDEAVEKATGRDWNTWVEMLDAWGATERSHTEIARHVAEEYHVAGWWAQSVTVGYERIRGMRKVAELPDGFSMNASKTVPIPVAELFELFVADEKRAAWLGDDVLRVRTAKPATSARFDILDDAGGILAVYFADKGEKSGVQVQLGKLESEEALLEQKTRWKSRLNDLARHIRDTSP